MYIIYTVWIKKRTKKMNKIVKSCIFDLCFFTCILGKFQMSFMVEFSRALPELMMTQIGHLDLWFQKEERTKMGTEKEFQGGNNQDVSGLNFPLSLSLSLYLPQTKNSTKELLANHHSRSLSLPFSTLSFSLSIYHSILPSIWIYISYSSYTYK